MSAIHRIKFENKTSFLAIKDVRLQIHFLKMFKFQKIAEPSLVRMGCTEVFTLNKNSLGANLHL